ncbi:hypothetical protein B0H15DRAFT_949626 [Mycena belliarum]|uniref:Uncharacterized protein n=1 Tax=Mycena belliarum TaxID=1033014 RepID=A0AAD6XUI2_9AGAR|nr:hypothetical protein B0H15DRAFT_949626 [Mycena belliae]
MRRTHALNFSSRRFAPSSHRVKCVSRKVSAQKRARWCRSCALGHLGRDAPTLFFAVPRAGYNGVFMSSTVKHSDAFCGLLRGTRASRPRCPDAIYRRPASGVTALARKFRCDAPFFSPALRAGCITYPKAQDTSTSRGQVIAEAFNFSFSALRAAFVQHFTTVAGFSTTDGPRAV